MSDGTGRLYKRGNTWWLDYSFRGERFRESSGSTKKGEAKALLRQRIEEMGSGGPKVNEESVTLEDLREAIVADYKRNERKSLDNVKLAFRHLYDGFKQGKHTRAVDITTDRVNRYVADRKDAGAANATINKELAALKRAFTIMVEADRLTRAPTIKKLQTRNVRSVKLTMADVEAICEEITDPVEPVVRFAAYTGWRKGEILSLTWRQVDFDNGTVHLDPGTTKNDKGRTFPFSALPPLAELLRQQRERTDKVERERGTIVPHVFHRDGKPMKSIRGAWNGACKRAGMPDAWFHDLRRTAVTNLDRAGVSRSFAKMLTGHKTDSVYERYSIGETEELRDSVEKLAALHQDTDTGDRQVEPIRRAQEG